MPFHLYRSAGFSLRRLGVLLALVCCAALLSPAASAQNRRAEDLSDEDINTAIETLKRHLYAEQRGNGSWDPARPNMESHDQKHLTGFTSMATLALLYAGESFQSENGANGGVKRALQYLAEAEVWGTYTRGIRAHIWAHLPDQFQSLLGDEAQYLLSAHNQGLFGYGEYNQGRRVDHSVTQYGVLGLWEFRKRGGRVDNGFWQVLVDHFTEVQNADGGWNYSGNSGENPGAPSYGSMTAAGLTVLYVAQQELYRNAATPNRAISDSIDRGIRWFDEHFAASGNPVAAGGAAHGRNPYYWYGMERVALASGIRTFNDLDWYRTGAAWIINNVLTQDLSRVRSTQGVTNVSFSLMFLTRGRVPIWGNKLHLGDTAWNNRPNDVYFLTGFLSDMYEEEVNWQVIRLDEPAETWLSAPITWVSSSDALSMTEEQTANLRRYLDLGGTLVVNPEGRGRLSDAIRTFVETQYPGLEFQRVSAEHPLLGLIHRVDLREPERPMVLSNGARDLIVLLPNDWGLEFQRNAQQSGDEWDVFSNLFAAYTDRANIPARLVTRFPARTGAAVGTVTVARGVVGDDPAFRRELNGWAMAGNPIFNMAGLDMDVKVTDLSELADSDATLLYLAGTGPVELSDEHLEAIKQFVADGGVVFVETLGGVGEVTDDGVAKFSLAIRNQLRRAFDAPTSPARDAPLVTGSGLGRGSGDTSRAVWRRFSRLRFNFGFDNRLEKMVVEGRPAVYFSHEDVTLGAMDLRHSYVNGYATETARQILANLLLQAKPSGG